MASGRARERRHILDDRIEEHEPALREQQAVDEQRVLPHEVVHGAEQQQHSLRAKRTVALTFRVLLIVF